MLFGLNKNKIFTLINRHTLQLVIYIDIQTFLLHITCFKYNKGTDKHLISLKLNNSKNMFVISLHYVKE